MRVVVTDTDSDLKLDVPTISYIGSIEQLMILSYKASVVSYIRDDQVVKILRKYAPNIPENPQPGKYEYTPGDIIVLIQKTDEKNITIEKLRFIFITPI